jgi:hypothetical protein
MRAASAALVLKLAAWSYSVTMVRANTLGINTGNCVFSELEPGPSFAAPGESLQSYDPIDRHKCFAAGVGDLDYLRPVSEKRHSPANAMRSTTP